MPSIVQKTSAVNSSTGVTTLTATLSGVTAGNRLVVFAAIKDFSHSFTMSISGDGGSWSSRGTQIPNSNAGLAQLWDKVAAGGSVTVTITVSSAVDAIGIVFWELTPSTFDHIVSAAGGGTSLSVGSITPGTSSGLALCGIWEGNSGAVITYTQGSGFSLDSQSNTTNASDWAVAGESKVYSTNASITAAWTWNNAASFGAGIFATYSELVTHTIAGNAGVAGANVAWTGAASGSVTADGSGNYTTSGLADGSYTITPTKSGYTFSPTNSGQTLAGSNITGVNFTATPVGGSGGSVVCIMQ